MGKMMKIVCASCKNEWQCMTGCGLSHALLQSVVREFPKETQDTVMEKAGEELPLFEFGFHLSACNGCGNIVSVPVLRFEEREEEYVGPCPVCQDDVAIITDMEDTVCPVCGNKTLLAEEIGRWD